MAASSSSSSSAFQQVHDGLTRAETTVDYTAPTGSLPPGFGVGPSGTMQIEILPDLECPGYPGGTIQLTYNIPTGTQDSFHPHPGVPYDGVRRRSYIPNTPEGRCLLTRYKYAFLHGHMFLVGRSVAKAKDNQVTWSSLPNHTTLKGTTFGFPDPEYLDKANVALHALGIPVADAIVNPNAPAAVSPDIENEMEIEVSLQSLSGIVPIPPPKAQAAARPHDSDQSLRRDIVADGGASAKNRDALPPSASGPMEKLLSQGDGALSFFTCGAVDDTVCGGSGITSSENPPAAPMPPPPQSQDAAPCAVDAVPLPPPYLLPATPHLAAVVVPESWILSSKESKRCTVISDNDDAALKRFRTLAIPVMASEIVVGIYVKDLTAATLQDLASLSSVSRVSRAALLTRGSLHLKKMPMMKTGLFAAVADRGNPSIKFGIFDLRAVHMHRDVVILAFQDASSSCQQEASYALYQTPEPSRFLTPLATAAVAAYIGVPNWAVPLHWSGSLPALKTITQRDYTDWMGVDGGFSSSLYAAALAYHVQHKLDIGKLQAADTAVSRLVMSHQPKRLVPTTGPQLLNLLDLAHGLASDAKMVNPLVEHGLNALAFNLVFRRLKLAKYKVPPDITAFQNALLKAMLYNVTLREVDFSGTNLGGFGEGIGKSWAMNAQPLIARINFSNCHLTGRDLRGLLPGLARIWCGETALAESIKMAGNPNISTGTWDFFFGTLDDPSILPFWPRKPPPPPSLAFLQELDLVNTNAIGVGLIKLSEKLSGLRSLKLSSNVNGDAKEILDSLAVAKAPLESFVGKNLSFSWAGALFGLGKTLKSVTFDGFKGDATPLLCGWPEAVPKLTVKFHGGLSGAYVSSPTGSGFSPGSLQIENMNNFGTMAVTRALSSQATGLKKLVLTEMHYSQLSKAVPVLAFCGLEYLRVDQGANKGSQGASETFWSIFASSTTLRDLQLPGQIHSPSEMAMIGRFLKANRSVQRINFDGPFLLDVESVKVLRSAFYGNKKVTKLQYLQRAKDRTMAATRENTNRHLQEVHAAKANIKRIFRSHYSKYNRNWRDKPNQLKLPYVEKIRVAKRKIGKMQRDSAKIGTLLSEIKTCVDRNNRAHVTMEEEKKNVKFARREGQLRQLAIKKTKFLTNLVTKLHKAKRRGREKKSAKTQVPRKTYYQSRNMWPRWPSASGNINHHRRVHSSYRYYNDPYSTRFHYGYGYYYYGCDTDRQMYLDDDNDVAAAAATAGIALEPEPNDGGGIDDGANSAIAAQAVVLAETNAVWDSLLCDVESVSAEAADPWENVDALTQFAESNLSAVLSPEFLAEVHNEVAELGADVAADICGTLDVGAAVNDKITEISESLDVPTEMLGTLVDSNLDGNFDLSALESSLGDMPDYDGDDDIDAGGIADDIADADDAVAMYAGAGPRDLDDGGPSFGGSGNAALAGARRRAKARKENRKLKRVREYAIDRLQTGYKSLVLQAETSEGGKTVEDIWPDDPREYWIEATRDQQIEAMSQSNLFQLPEVSEGETPSLLVEWNVQADDELDMSSGIEVVLVTQCSIDRLQNLEAQLASWTGKASVAMYLKTEECRIEAEQEILSCIKNAKDRTEQAHAGDGNFEIAVTIVEGCVDDEPYPINYLRNVALLEARRQQLRKHSSLERSAVLLVDVDFRPSATLYDALHTLIAADTILKSRQVVVCPAFESTAAVSPKSLAGLKACVDNGGAEGFHLSHFPGGHGPTQFDKFWAQSVLCKNGNVEDYWQKCYTVQYEKLFEPYVVMASRDVPLYDERFQGYGLNKVSHLASVARQKANKFIVLPGVFLVAPKHERSDSWANRYGSHTDETKFNQLWLKGLYHNFMKGLAEGRKAIVSDQTRAKHYLQRLQENESQRKENAIQFNQLPVRRNYVSSLSTNHPRA